MGILHFLLIMWLPRPPGCPFPSITSGRMPIHGKSSPWLFPLLVSQIRILTSKITQVCQDIHDIKLRRLLITCSDEEPNGITNNILTNRSDHKDTWGSDKSRPDPPDIHEDCAGGGIDYVYRIPNCLKLNNQNNREDHGKYPPQPRPAPSKMTPGPLPYPDPSEASERSSLPPFPFVPAKEGQH